MTSLRNSRRLRSYGSNRSIVGNLFAFENLIVECLPWRRRKPELRRRRRKRTEKLLLTAVEYLKTRHCFDVIVSGGSQVVLCRSLLYLFSVRVQSNIAPNLTLDMLFNNVFRCLCVFFFRCRLIKYCQEHQKTDVLVTGISPSENPFKENKTCSLL